MIQLTRLRHGDTFYLNPDLFERVDTHIDTVIRLTDGTEYVVVEPADEIARRIAEFRARVIALAAVLQSNAGASVDGREGEAVDVTASDPSWAAAALSSPPTTDAVTASWDGRS